MPPPDNDATEEDCAHRFLVSTQELFEVLKGRVPVQKRTLDVFTQAVQTEFNFSAELSPEEVEKTAQKALLRSQVFDAKELKRALLRKMEAILRDEGMPDADDPEKVRHFLNVILAAHPELLYQAQKAALAATAELQEAEELPAEWVSENALPVSEKNVYGILPSDLNSWERPFAEMLDRNLPHKPWSVNVLLQDGRGFYPDFVIGVEGRKTEDGVLLADPKFGYEQSEQTPKVLAEHRSYGRVLILYLDGGVRWMRAEYDPRAKKAVLSRELRFSDMAGF